MVYLQIDFPKIYNFDLIMNMNTNKHKSIVLRDIITAETRRVWKDCKVVPCYNSKNNTSYWEISHNRSTRLLRFWYSYGYRSIAIATIFKVINDIYTPIIRIDHDILVFLNSKMDMNENMLIYDDMKFDIFKYKKQILNGKIFKMYDKLSWNWNI